jgi:hypothetical protein
MLEMRLLQIEELEGTWYIDTAVVETVYLSSRKRWNYVQIDLAVVVPRVHLERK